MAIYGSPTSSIRKNLWTPLANLNNRVGDHPWCIAGDFNAYLAVEDKKGGAASGNRPCSLFKEWFSLVDFVDMNYQGPKFTWSQGGLTERIDCGICN